MSKHHQNLGDPKLPTEPIHRIINPLSRFLHIEAASGVVLLVCSLVALVAANSTISSAYFSIWKTPLELRVGSLVFDHSLKHWINDGLMAIFFFVIGLEVKREIVLGELRQLRRAALPLAAAVGGMVLPAAIYLALQWDQPGQRGWGIPMATDIAFVVGCMAVLGRRIPGGLRVVLLSLAIVDDIGAILVIAFGYTETIHLSWLATGLTGIAAVFLMQRLGVRSILVYTIVGSVTWLGFHESGIHATIAGVAIGLLTPARPYLAGRKGGELLRQASDAIHGGAWEEDLYRAEKVRQFRRISRETVSPLEYLIYVLHPWVAFVIMPVFALANAAVPVDPGDLLSSTAVAVIVGLTVGKPFGILLVSWLAVKSKLAALPDNVTWRHLLGGGFLAGIGFTMALFITGLAFDNDDVLRSAKVGVLIGSFISALIGMIVLATASQPTEK